MDAARKAIENPLLETNLDGAKKVIFAVSGGSDLSPYEVQEAAQIVQEILDPEANMIWWMSFDDSFEDEVKVTIIATWFNEQAKWHKQKTVKTNTRWDPIRNRQSENFVTRWVNQTIGWFTASQNGFSSQNWGFSTSNVDAPDTTNDAFRAPNNSDEDRETPAFMTKQLNNNPDEDK